MVGGGAGGNNSGWFWKSSNVRFVTEAISSGLEFFTIFTFDDNTVLDVSVGFMFTSKLYFFTDFFRYFLKLFTHILFFEYFCNNIVVYTNLLYFF